MCEVGPGLTLLPNPLKNRNGVPPAPSALDVIRAIRKESHPWKRWEPCPRGDLSDRRGHATSPQSQVKHQHLLPSFPVPFMCTGFTDSGQPPGPGHALKTHELTVRVSLLHHTPERFRGGLVFKAHRLLYHSTLGSRVIKKEQTS